MDKAIKTAIGSMEDVKEALELADVLGNTGLTGEIRLILRILNSKNEDIVINCIVPSATQITENIINVNLHIPNLPAIPAGVPNTVDNGQPDIARMEEIGKFLIEVLDGFRGYDFFTEVETTGEVIPDGKNWFYNIVIRYFYLRRDK